MKNFVVRQIAMAMVLCISLSLSAQDDIWSMELKKDLYQVNWLIQAYDGTVLVGGDKAMAGLHPTTGEVIWTNTDLVAVEKHTVQLLEGLPYFVAKTVNLMNKESIQVIDASTGLAILNTKDSDLSVMDYTVYPGQNAILFQLKKDKRYALAWYDLDKGAAIWSSDIDKAKGGLRGLIKGRSSFLKREAIIVDDRVILVYKKMLIGLNKSTGVQEWAKEYDKDIVSITVEPKGEKVYVGVDKKYDILNVKTGEGIIAEMGKLRDKLVDVKYKRNEIYMMHESGLNILDPETNMLKWKKPDKPGRADQVMKIKNGYVVVTKEEASGKIYLINDEGKKVWDKGISGAMVYSNILKKGIFYISEEKSNILDYKKGDKLIDKDVKIKGIPAVGYDDQANELVVFSDKKLFRFNLDKGTSELLAEDIKFKKFKDKEDWVRIDVRENGYFISSSQNNAFVTKTGKVKFNNHYKPVKSSAVFGALATMSTSVMGVNVIDLANDLKDMDKMMAGSFQDASEDGAYESTKGVFSMSSGNTNLLSVTQTRYDATKSDKDFVYILMQGDNGKLIAKVSKDSGKTIKSIKMKEKSPIYIMDDYENNILFVEKSNNVICRSLAK